MNTFRGNIQLSHSIFSIEFTQHIYWQNSEVKYRVCYRKEGRSYHKELDNIFGIASRATDCRVWGLNHGASKIFSLMCTHLKRFWCPSNFLYTGYLDFPSEVQRPGCDTEHRTTCNAQVQHEYSYNSTLVLCFHWRVERRSLTFILRHTNIY